MNIQIKKSYKSGNDITVYHGDCIDLLDEIPDGHLNLIVTSPPYNIGKEYESKKALNEYISFQSDVISKCAEKLHPKGSICWQVGNTLNKSGKRAEVIPLDIILYNIFKDNQLHLRNRIIWHFGHGEHAKYRFSGRHEAVLWFTKTDDYIFNLDNVRVEQLYPGKKSYKGPNKGEYSGHIMGKNPSDYWENQEYDSWDIPNVKSNHREKTSHPCQFPIALVERLVKALTNEGDIIFDPFLGAGTTIIAAIKNNRKAIGSEIDSKYVELTKTRIKQFIHGELPIREDKPVYKPPAGASITRRDDK